VVVVVGWGGAEENTWIQREAGTRDWKNYLITSFVIHIVQHILLG
jgi:hypothetical protein